jgi:hypothetical protein
MLWNTETAYKLDKLQAILGVHRYAAVGIFECLILSAQVNAPRGDIGKMEDEDIALSIDYKGDHSRLVVALVESGCLCLNDAHRLIIDDWPNLCDNKTHILLRNERKNFANGDHPHPNKHLRIEGSTKRTRRRDRVRAAGGEIPVSIRIAVLSGANCAKCGRNDDLTIDHIIPISLGGTNTPSNLQALCRRCNSAKKDCC